MAESMSARAARLRHHQGQRLLGSDLTHEYDNLTWLRSLHVLALHDTWGIALGFEVQLGPLGTVLVGPGFAYDCLGHEIVLVQGQALVGPHAVFPGAPAGTAYELVMSYDAELGGVPSDDGGVCLAAGAAPGCERPVFAWRRPSEARLGLEIPLLGVTLTSSGLGALDLNVRRYTQRLARPHIVAGATTPEQQWTDWRTAVRGPAVGLQTTVDTSAAGFVGTPHYFASLHFDSEKTLLGSPNDPAAPRFAVFTSVANARRTEFTFRVALAAREAGEILVFLRGILGNRGTLPMRVAWVGLEPVAGCAPAPRFFELSSHILFQQMLREVP
jgi:hypothetical protein